MWTAATALAVAVILFLTALIFIGLGWVVKQLSSVLLPLAVAGVIAYLLDPVVDFVQRRRLPFSRRRFSRPWAIIMVFFLAVMFLVGMVATVVPRLTKDTQLLLNELPEFQERLRKRVDNFIKDPPFKIKLPQTLKELQIQIPDILSDILSEDPERVLAQLGSSAIGWGGAGDSETEFVVDVEDVDSDRIGEVIGQAFTFLKGVGKWLLEKLGQIRSWFGLLAGFALMPVYVFYFLTEKKGIQDNWTDYLPIRESKMKEEIVFVLRSINDSLIVFFRSQVLVAMCVGILLMIGFSIIGLRYGVLLGFLAGILGIVPYLGVMLSIVPALTISILQSEGFVHPLLTLGVFVFVQWLEGLVISPKIIGDRVGMHPLTVIISIMTGATLLGGITGGVLAIPLTAALRTLMFRYVWRRRKWTGDEGQELPASEAAGAEDDSSAVP